MSILFGLRLQNGALADATQLRELGEATRHWTMEGTIVYAKGRVGMACQLYRTHERSRLETGPIFDDLGNMLSLDGRLDNHRELCALLDIPTLGTADSEIMLAAFRHWGDECFSRFIGDWALAIWSEKEQTIYLARDHAGTRSLYFEKREGELRWSTYLDTLLSNREPRPINATYIAQYLLGLTLGDRTPYAGIKAVTPAHVLIFRPGKFTRKLHWEPIPSRPIRYRKDSDYEQHFLDLLKQAIARRTGPGAPILAQLSGGMDSSTIVCVSDLMRRSDGEAPRELLDTVSFYDDSEPSWNERPFFTAVEDHRGKAGFHMDVSGARPTFQVPEESTTNHFLLPGIDSGVQLQSDNFEELIAGHGFRVVLSGLGGDELLGGVPSPLPELSDYLMAGRVPTLLRKGVAWGLSLRKPLVQLLWDTACFSGRAYFGDANPQMALPPWISSRATDVCAHLNKAGLQRRRIPLPSPSVIVTASTWWTLLETLPNPQLSLGERREYRFPYLDRDLVDFLLRVPNDQLVRPGRRRSLMRRAVKDVVPKAVLERRRKGYIARSPAQTLSEHSPRIRELFSTSVLAEHGFVDRDVFTRCLQEFFQGTRSEWSFSLLRTCALELWLRSEPRLLLRP